MSTFKEAFGFNLKFLRKAKNMTQEKLCELIDLHTRQLSKIETGGHFPSCKTIEKLCSSLEVSPRELFDFDFECEECINGTDGYYKAVKSGNMIYLQDAENKNMRKFSVEDINYTKLAKDCKRPVTVKHIENGKTAKILTYHPDGVVEILRDFSDKEYEENMKFILEKSKKIARDKEFTNFIKTAFLALEDSNSLDQLELMITGMKLAKKK